MFDEADKKRFPETRHQPGEKIHGEGQNGDVLGYVESGLVKGALAPTPGTKLRETVILVGSGGWFGFECFTSGPNIIQYLSVNESVIRLVPRTWVVETAPPSTRESLLKGISEQWGIRASFGADKSLTVEVRILRWFVLLRQLTDQHEIYLTHNDLADMAGVTRASVNPALQSLKNRGLVDLHHGYFILPELEILQPEFRKHIQH